ncbi:MAG: hypothetical protein Q9201_004173 [Fulgogasparrea decipioides]
MPIPNIPNYLLYFRDDLRLSTWILLGAVIQSLLVITLPHHVALLPAALILGTRIILSTLRNEGFLPSSEAEAVVPGRYTAQVPNPDGSITTASANKIYLGKTPTLIATEEDCTNTLVWISYWRSLEDLHSFARGETHRAGWDWYSKEQKKYPHIGIQHETYLAPKGHWENIAYNFRPFGIGKTKHLVRGEVGDAEGRFISPLQLTSGDAWNSMKSRMGMAEE